MHEEIRSIEKNDTREFVSLPKGHKAIGVKWVYKTKKNAKGEIERYKARLVAKAYSQKAGIDYDEVFALVSHLETIRLILFYCSSTQVDNSSNGHEVYLLEWSPRGRSVHQATVGIQGERRKRQSSQAKEGTLWTKISIESMVHSHWQVLPRK